MKFDIDTDEIVSYTNKLEKLHKSGLPVAVRQTLNGAAFGVKGSKNTNNSTLQQEADRAFTNRSKNFFKITSKVEPAKGFDIKTMQSTVGFTDKRLKGNSNFAVSNLAKQEEGGQIQGRSFVPLRNARKGKNNDAMVRPKFRLNRINEVINAESVSGANKAEKFIKSAVHAGKGGYVLGNIKAASGGRYLYHINSLKKQKDGSTTVNSQPIYSYEEDRSFMVSQTAFFEKATTKSGRRMEELYKEQAQKQIERLT